MGGLYEAGEGEAVSLLRGKKICLKKTRRPSSRVFGRRGAVMKEGKKQPKGGRTSEDSNLEGEARSGCGGTSVKKKESCRGKSFFYTLPKEQVEDDRERRVRGVRK